MPEPTVELATSKVEKVAESNQQPVYRSFVRQEPEELKVEEVENNRHSTMGLYLEISISTYMTKVGISDLQTMILSNNVYACLAVLVGQSSAYPSIHILILIV